MESILEIKDGCLTSEQLLKSYAFARYLKIYKKEFLEDLEKKGEKHSQEAKQKMDLIANLSLKDILQILERDSKGADLEATVVGSQVTPLFDAVMGGSKEAVQLLLNKGANVDHKTPSGDTAAAYAIDTEIAVLLDQTADAVE